MGSLMGARTVLAVALASGVTDLVVCPGSRSAPLALAAATAEGLGVRVHVRVDERSAGFFALGLGKAGRLAAVITTSGSAVANLLPAVLEAHHARVPLVLLTADRPARLVGTGASQTTRQVGLFSDFAPCFRVDSEQSLATVAEVVARAVGQAVTGPVQINLELDEPLIAEAPDDLTLAELREQFPRLPVSKPAVALEPTPLRIGRRPVVLVGSSPPIGVDPVVLAAEISAPLIVECGPGGLRYGTELLATSLADGIDHAVVLGHLTVYPMISRLLAGPSVRVTLIGDETAPGPGVVPDQRVPVPIAPEGLAEDGWLAAWRAADAELTQRWAAEPDPSVISGPLLAATLAESLVPGEPLFVGPSSPIRDLGTARFAAGVEVVANRGLAGIDGVVSTALGVASGRGRATLYCGDLTFVHDSNGLMIGLGESRPNLRIVVADDDGGSIFATLPYGTPEYAPVFERFFATPSGVDLVALVRSYGVPVRRIAAVAELEMALSEEIVGTSVLVVSVDRQDRRSAGRNLRKLAHQVVAELAEG